MTALKGKAIDGFLARRDPSVAAVLIYGPDSGLVRERADALSKAVVPDLKDPFNYIELTEADLKQEQARIADEAAALSFAGGERVVRLRAGGEAATGPSKLLIEGVEKGHLKPNALVIVEAGDLSPRSGLRKLFEGAKRAVALPCYADSALDLRGLARDMAGAEGLSFDDDALSLLMTALGEDRGVSRSEIGKIILYKGPKDVREGDARITAEDVAACLADSVGDAADLVAAAAADGRPDLLAAALYKSAQAGASPIGLLRALQRSFLRLQTAEAHVRAGAPPREAMKKLRPPVFFKEQQAFETRLRRWPAARINAALDTLLEAELAAKTTGAPQTEIVERAALRIAHLAGR